MAVVRHGNLSLAGQALGADHTTVSRRIKALEMDLGAPLFEKRDGRLCILPSGERLKDGLTKIENDILLLGMNVQSDPDGLSGPVRIGATEGFAASWLMPTLTRFRKENPNLRIEFIFSNQIQDLDKEIDIAIRYVEPTGNGIVRKPLGLIDFSFFGISKYFEHYGDLSEIRDISAHRFIIQAGQFRNPALASLLDIMPEECIALRASDSAAVLAEMEEGGGLAFLPNYVENLPRLQGRIQRASLRMDIYTGVFLCYSEAKRNIARLRRVAQEIDRNFTAGKGTWFR